MQSRLLSIACVAGTLFVPLFAHCEERKDPKNAPARPQPVGIALAIGLNSVDPVHYAGWSGDLNACENDANDMATIAQSKGFQVTRLLTQHATRQAVIDKISQAAAALNTGDVFMISYSGHGGQIPDQNGDEADNLDETWCLYDGEWTDDELAAIWTKFKPGVRVIAFSDSCHSGTVTKFREYEQYTQWNSTGITEARTWAVKFDDLLSRPAAPVKKHAPSPVRAMPLDVVNATFQKNRAFYEKLGKESPLPKRSEAATQCTVLLISGCQDNQLSLDGPVNGLFTGKLKFIWNGGQFTGDYRDFRESIALQMPSHQSPNYYVTGAPNLTFEQQKPFTR